MAAAPFSRAMLLAMVLAASACAEPEQPAGDAVVAVAGTQAPPSGATNPGRPVGTPAQRSTGSPLPDPGPAEPSDCNAPIAARFVGRTADSATRAELTAAVAPIAAIRWVGPGDATTEDYSPTRLNVMLDVGGVIRSSHCG